MPIISGILLGLGTLLFIGPVLFYLIKSALEAGVKAGIAVAFGIIIGDVICVILAIAGMGSFFENGENQKWLALAGGVILLLIGLKYILKPNTNSETEGKFQSKSLISYFTNGFLINFVNPFVFAVWIAFYAITQKKFESETEVYLSLIFILLTIFLTDCLKAVFAHKLLKFIQPKSLKTIFQIFGVVMVIFGMRLLFVFFQL